MASIRRTWRVALAAGLAIATALVLAAGPSPATTGHANAASSHGGAATTGVDEQAFRQAMDRLWIDHVTWTRLFIVSFSADLPDLDATTARLLRNQADIGDAIEPFYGAAAADRLTSLLQEHILLAADVLAAAKAGDDAAFEEANDAWYANAREIARFLSDANPANWRFADMHRMMREHLDLTLAEAAAQLGGDFPRSVALYDDVEDEILHMAGDLADGLIAQFPDRFE